MFQLLATRRIGFALEPLQDVFVVLKAQVLVFWEALIGLVGGGLQLSAHACYKAFSFHWDPGLLAIQRDTLPILLFRNQLLAGVAELFAAGKTRSPDFNACIDSKQTHSSK